MSDLIELLALFGTFIGICLLGNYVSNINKTIDHYKNKENHDG